ncbi:MAG: hypothetical protein DWQ16_01955 [Proteobacteria bacterium]|nr:MAG: hypothetical protein DWQ16_01955 [Pseudomonadota bacterium]
MKIIKISLILFFASMINTNAEDIYLSCESTTKLRTSFIINDKKKLLILDGVKREIVEWKKEFITFWKSETIKEISEPRNFKPDTLDRISGSYGSYNCKVVEKTLF